ncbi:MAG: hypothetical protein RL130_1452 [Actinomycetota bacterium]|jgi:Flp pilus assembly protein TadG
MKQLKAFWRDEKGSISLLIMSLFMATVIVSVILTNVSSIYLAKRALTQATESAAQRGVRNLDTDAYYKGEYNLWKFAKNLLGESETDPGIPIDCEKGRADALSALNDWIQIGTTHAIANSRINLEAIQVNRVDCDGFQLTVETSAEVRLPFVLPFVNLESFEISSTVASIAQRKITTNFYGIEIG